MWRWVRFLPRTWGLFVEACECLAHLQAHTGPSHHLKHSMPESGTFSIFDVSGRWSRIQMTGRTETLWKHWGRFLTVNIYRKFWIYFVLHWLKKMCHKEVKEMCSFPLIVEEVLLLLWKSVIAQTNKCEKRMILIELLQ